MQKQAVFAFYTTICKATINKPLCAKPFSRVIADNYLYSLFIAKNLSRSFANFLLHIFGHLKKALEIYFVDVQIIAY